MERQIELALALKPVWAVPVCVLVALRLREHGAYIDMTLALHAL